MTHLPTAALSSPPAPPPPSAPPAPGPSWPRTAVPSRPPLAGPWRSPPWAASRCCTNDTHSRAEPFGPGNGNHSGARGHGAPDDHGEGAAQGHRQRAPAGRRGHLPGHALLQPLQGPPRLQAHEPAGLRRGHPGQPRLRQRRGFPPGGHAGGRFSTSAELQLRLRGRPGPARGACAPSSSRNSPDPGGHHRRRRRLQGAGRPTTTRAWPGSIPTRPWKPVVAHLRRGRRWTVVLQPPGRPRRVRAGTT